MQALDPYTKVQPMERFQRLKEFSTRLSRNEFARKELSYWNMNINPELVRLQGRVLPKEPIQLGEKSETITDSRGTIKWPNRIRGCVFPTCIELCDWAVVYAEDKFNSFGKTMDELVGTARDGLGMVVQKPLIIKVRSNHTNEFKDTILNNEFIRSSKCKFVLVILPFRNEEPVYIFCKKYFSVKLGIPSQVRY